MSKFFSKDKKKSENEKIVTSKSITTGDGHIIHSSSATSFTHHQITTRTTETRTITSVQKIEGRSPFASQSSLNSYTEKFNNASGSNSSLQKFDKKGYNALPAKPSYKSSISTDAVPFARSGLYQSTPPRSAFTSTPLTTSSSTINLNYKSPYVDHRVRSRSIASPIAITSNIQPSSFTNRLSEIPNNINSTSQNNNEELKQKLKVSVTKSSRFYDDPSQSKVPMYKTRSKRRGKLLLVNNIKFVSNEKHVRKGAELDEENVVQLFTQMGFEIVRCRNLNKKDMENKIINFRNSASLKKVDIGTVIIMSHGTGKESSGSTEVVCTDGQLLQTTWIINQFDGSLCPHLLGKPKIFIFQCCRGDNREEVIQIDSVPFAVPRKLSDMLIAYSTIPGFVSHRDPQNGTWYIQAICKVFMEHAYDTDVENLLKIVDNKLSSLVSHVGSKQTSSFENRGFKTCYLHPQLFE